MTDKEVLGKLIEALEKSGLRTNQGFSTNFRSPATRERNLKVQKDILYGKYPKLNRDLNRFAESMKRVYGVDIWDREKFPVTRENFSWRKLQEKLAFKFGEADTSGAFVQFLRAGIQQIATDMYERTPTTYEDWITVIPSGRLEELYTPNHGVSFPREVAAGGKYPEVAAAALDMKLRNRKYGSMYSVEWELLEDDQTGTFRRNSGTLGEFLRMLKEVLVYGKLASVAGMKYVDFEIPVSETQPSDEATYPWSTALVGGAANRPSAYGGLTQANIQDGITALMRQKNLQGIALLVAATRLIISPINKFDAHILLNSAYYPSGAASSGDVGGAFAVNPLKGILDLTVSRFVAKNDGTFDGDSNAWYLVDDSKPWFVLQEREPISVVQENPASGRSFEEDVYRFKGRTRCNADFIDPRFAWQGNDGSV